MENINISFNNKDYSIPETVLIPASSNLRSHLTSVINGSGESIKFGGAFYDISATYVQCSDGRVELLIG